jgi:glycosyltransferase involved in cell wall biosynthesis
MKRNDFSRKINILQLIGSFTSGGAENMVVNLVNGLAEDTFNVILSARAAGPAARGLINGNKVVIIEKNSTVDISYLLKLIRLIKKYRIDIIHSHMFGANMYGFLAAKLSGAKIIQTVHGMDCLNSKKRMIAYRLMHRFIDKIVTVSESLRVEFLKYTKVNQEKVFTIHNGIDINKYSVSDGYINKRAQLHLPPACPVIGAVGNIKHVKGYDTLILAAAGVIERYPEARFLIVGETVKKHEQEKMRLDNLIKKLGLGNNVQFMGYREDIYEILPVFDVYVLPSRSEGQSLALLEAMASGRSIVATDVGGNPLLIKHGISGILTPAEDHVSLGQQIIRVLDDKNFAAELGKNAREDAVRRFSVENMAAGYDDLYKSIFYKQ